MSNEPPADFGKDEISRHMESAYSINLEMAHMKAEMRRSDALKNELCRENIELRAKIARAESFLRTAKRAWLDEGPQALNLMDGIDNALRQLSNEAP